MVTDVENLVAACGDQSVCQFDGASVSNAGELAAALPEGVRVVVIPQPDQAESVQTSALVSQFKSATGADTVIMIEDRATDRFAVASDRDATSITEALYSQGEPDGGLAVAAITDTFTTESGEPAAPGFDGGAIVLAGVGIVLVAAAVTTIAVVAGRRRRKKALGPRRVAKELNAALNGPEGEQLKGAIDDLRGRAEAYPDLRDRLQMLANHVSELFVRVRRRGTDQQLRLLQAKYRDTLPKLLKALGDDYYGDIQRNPQFWSNPEGRLQEVRRAVDSVDQQAIENIRQVNESLDLEFKVALDSLIRTVDEAQLSDVYTDREQDRGR